MKNIIFSYLFLSVTLMSCQAQLQNKLAVIDFEKATVNDSIQLLDVRTEAEFKSGHIKNSSWADWNDEKEFIRRTSFLNQKKTLYVYCLSGARSAAAATFLRNKGFTVLELQGGINAWKASNKKVEGKKEGSQMTMKEYENLINSNKPILVDFGATWCPPCKIMNPIIAQIEEKYLKEINVVKIDANIHEDVILANKVTALPVFIIYKNGKPIWRKDGIVSKDEIEAAIKQFYEN